MTAGCVSLSLSLVGLDESFLGLGSRDVIFSSQTVMMQIENITAKATA